MGVEIGYCISTALTCCFVIAIMDVKGKLVVITGSGQGLGKAFALRLLNAGAKVCLSDLREDTGLATKEEMEERFGKENVHFMKCDVTKQEELTALYDGAEEHFKAKIAVMSGTELAMERMGLDNGGKGGLIV